jgi:hypothetical protein
MIEPIYYLFGSEAVDVYLNHDHETESFEQLAERIKVAGHYVFMYDESEMHPTMLLNEFCGWGGFAEIEGDLYELLKP